MKKNFKISCKKFMLAKSYSHFLNCNLDFFYFYYHFEYFWDVPKKWIPRAEFHGIFLDFVECGIVQKMESLNYCLKRRISALKKMKFSWSLVEIPLFRKIYGLSTLWAVPNFPHSTKFKIIPGNCAPWNPLFRHIPFFFNFLNLHSR